MPIYEFQCQACGNEVEVLQKISDPHLTDCDACGKTEMRKKVTAAAFRLSGAGWYETDFKAGDKKNLTESGDNKTSKTKKDDVKASGSNKAASDTTKANVKDSSNTTKTTTSKSPD